MPRIDPLQLLNCLNVLLNPDGGIKSEHDVARLSSIMGKFSKKLVSKCVYLLILKASNRDLLSMFMAAGGWTLIFNWLVHAIEAKNYPFLVELLEVIIICPVDIERLKSNPIPRQIKFLSKDNTVDARVKELASDIVHQWLAIVKGTPATPGNADSSANNVDAKPNQALNDSSNEKHNAVAIGANDNRLSDTSVGDEDEEEEEEEVDINYVKSTSPSSSSIDSEDSDVYIPYRKPHTGKKKSSKKEKLSKKLATVEGKVKLKSKLIHAEDEKNSEKTPIKLKIKKKKDSPELSKSKKNKTEEKSLEEKLKEKRKQKEEKEKEKFAKFKQEREKKESKDKKEKRDKSSSKEKSQDDRPKGDISKFIPKPIDKLGRIPKLPKEARESDKNQLVAAPAADETKRKDESKHERLSPKTSDEKKAKKDESSKAIIQKLREEREKELQRKEAAKKAALAAPSKKPVSMSVEKRNLGEKPKTVKAYNSKFRLTGLEQEVTPKPPSSRKPVPQQSPSTAVTSSPSSNAVKRSPTRDIEIEPLEKKMKSPDSMLESPVSSKSKIPFLQDCDFLSNAMNIAVETQKEQQRKRKKSIIKGDAEASSPTVKPDKEVKPTFKFYKDTLESTTNEETSPNEPIPEVVAPEANLTKDKDDVDENKSSVEKNAQGLKSSLALFRTGKGPKKSVKWKSDSELESVQFFEVDISERTNVVRDFWAMQMMERNAERESLLMVRKTDNDKMAPKTSWKPLIPIDIPNSITVRGSNSQEKNIQYARERRVSPSLFYDRSMIPDSPAEPDLEIHPSTVPPVIPLDDISGSQDSVTDFSNYKWPEPKQFAPDPSDFSAMSAAPNFMMGAGMPPPMFPFPDGTFPSYGNPLFPGCPVVPPGPPANWNTTSGDQQQGQQQPPWGLPPPNLVPPPGMVGPPPFGMMAPPFPIPGAAFPGAPNMFPVPPGMNSSGNNADNNDTSNHSGSGGNNFSGNSEGKKWNNDKRFHRKDGWKNNYSSDRGSRDKRNSNSWRGSGSSKLCRIFQKDGHCNVNGCRFYHPEN